MTDPLGDLRAQARQLAQQRATAVTEAVGLSTQADAQRTAATDAAALGDSTAFSAATDAATQLFGQRRSVLGTIAEVDGELAKLVAALEGDPCDLESDLPLALLPVRLETRYSADGTTLRVRIFPDDVHVDRLDRGLSDEERAAGIAYWQAIWDGSVTEDVAWQTLLGAVKPSRAEWVAAALSPDLTTRPNPPTAGATPVVGNPPALRQLAPVARALPDRFVVVAVQGGQISTATGAPIPPSLVVGLPPTADPSQLIQNGTVTLGPGMQWLVDPDEAERVGMLVNDPARGPELGRRSRVRDRRASEPGPGRLRDRARDAARGTPVCGGRRVRRARDADEQHRVRPRGVDGPVGADTTAHAARRPVARF
jgi:hypothetical protein